jgi:hypothetical protein
MEHIQHVQERKIMAVKTETLVTVSDDLTGEAFNEGEGETLAFSFDGTNYELDLNNKNATAFRKAFEKYVKAARIKPTRGRKPGTQQSSETAAIREWAKENGLTVNDRGRVPSNVVDLYHAAHTES